MAKDEKSRQKKLARKTAKRKAKQQQIRAAGSLSKVQQAARQTHKPILACKVPVGLFANGIGTVVFARGSATGEVALASFLVDVRCLGIKDAMYRVGGPEDYQMCLQAAAIGGASEDWEPACLKKLLEDVSAWAGELGFKPHPDSQMGMALFGDEVDSDDCTRSFTFGKDGKPFFTAGPNDGPRRVKQIIATLERSCGQGNYHFMLPLGGGGNLVFDEDDEDLIEGELEDDDPQTRD